ncbi:MAG TPA: glycosyl transferase group 1 family protein [Rhodospirillaceae bacterium]|nr:MAG: hypothetical protein A2018_02075 [Alphaproteobacteria bacterium GWF2_58_20]HAU29566.1 glycosyl transferase group 1 family protein [Rhodospirillaceae bacterium]
MIQHPTINIVIGSLCRGGAERHLSQILPALARRGFRFRVILLSGLGDFAPVLEKAGIELVLPTPRIGHCRILSAFSRLFHLWRFVLSHRHEPFHFFLPQSYLMGMLACLLACHRGPRIMSRRSLNDYQKKHPHLARLERFFHRHITAALGNSEAVVRQLGEEGIPAEKRGLIYNGIETERFEAAREMRTERDIPEGAPVMAIVANLIPYKGHADLLAALAMVAPNMPKNWRLLVIGRDDGIGSALRRQAEQADLSEHVLWLGVRTDIEALLKSSNIGLLTSHEEGFSNAILEAMAAGLPVIATDVGGNREAVGDTAGIIVPPKAPEDLGRAILALAKNADLRQKMGLAAKARVRENFSMESCVDAYARFYEETLPCAD